MIFAFVAYINRRYRNKDGILAVAFALDLILISMAVATMSDIYGCK